jgi:hypothetical protein
MYDKIQFILQCKITNNIQPFLNLNAEFSESEHCLFVLNTQAFESRTAHNCRAPCYQMLVFTGATITNRKLEMAGGE